MRAIAGPWHVLKRLALAMQARRWVRSLSLQASEYYAKGVAATAVVDELAEVHTTANELGGGPRWLS